MALNLLFIANQDIIASVPFIYVETFIMLFISFCIGYFGSLLYANSKAKRLKEEHLSDISELNKQIKTLKRVVDNRSDLAARKEIESRDIDKVKFQRKAFAPEVISQKAPIVENTNEINFTRIGEAAVSERDNLQDIEGIGPYTETKLNDLGIYTFEQISKFTVQDIKTVTRLIKFFPDRIVNDRWVAKAKTQLALKNENEPSIRLKKI